MDIITVREFIEETKKLDGVTILKDDQVKEYTDKYIEKVKKLNEERNLELSEEDIQYLIDTLARNVKYVINVQFTDEELKVADRDLREMKRELDIGKQDSIFMIEVLSDEDTINPFLNHEQKEKFLELYIAKKQNERGLNLNREYLETVFSRCQKETAGAGPGQYVQGRIVSSNKSSSILDDHETTHAATINLYDASGKIIVPDFDSIKATTDPYKFLKQLEGITMEGGYNTFANENGEIVKYANDSEYVDLMETCTESIAGMLNEPPKKKFEKFCIPTDNMSAIPYNREARNMLIMAIGSDAFITDMLRQDKKNGINKLDKLIRQYSNNSISLIDFLKLLGEFNEPLSKIESHRKKEGVDLPKVLYEKSKELIKICDIMFENRMKNCQESDKEEQQEYYETIKEELAQRVIKSSKFEQYDSDLVRMMVINNKKDEFNLQQLTPDSNLNINISNNDLNNFYLNQENMIINYEFLYDMFKKVLPMINRNIKGSGNKEFEECVLYQGDSIEDAQQYMVSIATDFYKSVFDEKTEFGKRCLEYINSMYNEQKDFRN